MAKYVIEIGVDSKAAPRYDGTYSHAISLIRVDDWKGTNKNPWWFTRFSAEDEIAFRICDYTLPSIGRPQIAIKSFVAYFVDAKDRQSLSGCLKESVICIGKDYLPVQDTHSLVIDEAPCWRFVNPDSGAEVSFKLTVPGRAFLRVSMAATMLADSSETQLRWFTHDPEIIVGEGGFHKPPRRRPSSPRRR